MYGIGPFGNGYMAEYTVWNGNDPVYECHHVERAIINLKHWIERGMIDTEFTITRDTPTGNVCILHYKHEGIYPEMEN